MHSHRSTSCRPCPSNRHLDVFDYIVVGAGTSGAPLAKELTDDGVTSVLLLDAGEDRNREPDVLSVGSFTVELDPRWNFFYPADTALIPPSVEAPAEYSQGVMWGGSSGHNALLAVRGTPAIYNAWAGAEDKRWSYDALLPTMKRLETYTAVATEVIDRREHGVCGPLYVTQAGPLAGFAPIADSALTDAYVTEGAAYTPDYNNPRRGVLVTGDAQFYVDPRTVTRSWAGSAFLNESVVLRLPNGDGKGRNGRPLEIRSDVLVDRLVFADEIELDDLLHAGHEVLGSEIEPRAVGVRYTGSSGEEIIVLAREKVILSAGVVGDPAILMRSGIGPASVLEPLGIDVRIANDNVGRNMQHQYGSFVIFAARPDDPPTTMVSFFDLDAECACCLPPRLGAPHPCGARSHQITSFVNNVGLEGLVGALAINVQPAPVGRIDILSTDPAPENVRVTMNFFKAPGEIAEAVAVLKLLARVSLAYTGTMPLVPEAPLYPAGEFPGGGAPNDDALAAWAVENGTYVYHSSGTARMACSAEEGVVDTNLDVFGVSGLSIASNAVVPVIADGNTAWTAYIVGLVKAQIETGTGRCRSVDDHRAARHHTDHADPMETTSAAAPARTATVRSGTANAVRFTSVPAVPNDRIVKALAAARAALVRMAPT